MREHEISRREFLKLAAIATGGILGSGIFYKLRKDFGEDPLSQEVPSVPSSPELSETPTEILIPTPSATPTITPTTTEIPTPTEIISPTPDRISQLEKEYATGDSIKIKEQIRYLPTGLLLPTINLSRRIVKQPQGNIGWVSQEDFTSFLLPEYWKNHGVLAEHDSEPGKILSEKVKLGDELILFLGNGTTIKYQISNIEIRQALEPRNPSSSFKNIKTGKIETVEETFYEFYTKEGRLTLQTCNSLGNFRIFYLGTPES
jgi:hypothetical protein